VAWPTPTPSPAYAESVAETQYVRRYLDATRLRKADIKDFAQHGCLCQVRQHDEERRYLIDTFFRFDTPDVYAVKRLASLCFFLDIVAQSEGQPLSQDAFRSVLYFWSFGNHHAYIPKGNFLSPAQRWRIFQLRQYFVFAIESLWSLFLHRVEVEALNGAEYLAWLLDELDLGGSVGGGQWQIVATADYYGSTGTAAGTVTVFRRVYLPLILRNA